MRRRKSAPRRARSARARSAAIRFAVGGSWIRLHPQDPPLDAKLPPLLLARPQPVTPRQDAAPRPVILLSARLPMHPSFCSPDLAEYLGGRKESVAAAVFGRGTGGVVEFVKASWLGQAERKLGRMDQAS